ncbi:olfactory receptor 11L1-like [Xenopus tropicalis]|uniref:Olfactory receptor n=1 Tax=Xenopus tropicalis TaxID=8364 RepID=A0A8J1J8L4_XENTR|nr:olfactory receptor 11L1-like [Xenopus tropicalis]
MDKKNLTTVSELFLLGFQNLNCFRIPLFCLILFIYLLTVSGNIVIIVLVSISRNLQSPMYFFVQQLSLCDLLQTTCTVPVLLWTVLNAGAPISVGGCITQFYFVDASESVECLLLTVMSFDRYLAICNPLHYRSLMNPKLCVELTLIPWLLGFSIGFITANAIGNLQFCNQNIINHFFCDYFPLLELSCMDTFIAQTEAILQAVLVVFIPVILIIISYVFIIHTVLKIVSTTGRQKAFSTCSSHLIVVLLFYGSLVGIYVVPPRKQSMTISKVLSLSYTLVTPLMNPVIYSLRSKDMKKAFKKMLSF